MSTIERPSPVTLRAYRIEFRHHRASEDPVLEASMLERVDENLWSASAPFGAGGMIFGVRMLVIRLPNGSHFLHSPIELTEELQREIDALGHVAFLVAPNKVHHLYLGAWVAAYPDAKLHGAIGLPDKRKDLEFDGALMDARPDPGWADVIEQVQFHGQPHVNEMVFLHKPTRTLMLTDLSFNLYPEDTNFLTRLYLRLSGASGRLRGTLVIRMLTRDKAAARESLDKILALDFDRISVTHGRILEHGGPDALRRALDWL
jgi:hypothetical protein